MNIKKNITELIGNTPLLDISDLFNEIGNNKVYAKLEYLNPGGSIKDRAAFFMIKSAIEKGKIKEGGTIIEATSGNTGIGLASLASTFGLKVVLTMPSSMSVERQKMLRAYGAKIELTDASLGMKGAIDKANEINRNTPNSIIIGQFENDDNVRAHFETTGPEIYNDLDGKIDYLFATFGTGGTISGIAKFLKTKNKNIHVIGLEPKSSPFMTRTETGLHKIQGIGAGFKPDILDIKVIDEFNVVSDEDAYKFTREFPIKKGILVGISSGAAIAGTYNYIREKELKGKNIVVILPDSGDRYLSTVGLFE